MAGSHPQKLKPDLCEANCQAFDLGRKASGNGAGAMPTLAVGMRGTSETHVHDKRGHGTEQS